MNQYIKKLNRIEFSVTLACTGKCKHCSQGEHVNCKEHLDGDIAADIVRKTSSKFQINSLMTFGGEPLLYAEDICKIHCAVRNAGISKRQLITNGYFSKDESKIREVTRKLVKNGVNDILLSVDAFHQEFIPIEPVKVFANAALETGVRIRTQPAWLVGKEDNNLYNIKTKKLLLEFNEIEENSGNIIFPNGNALKYLKEYFEDRQIYENPYEEDPFDVKAFCVSANGDVLNGNVYQTDILELIDNYKPTD